MTRQSQNILKAALGIVLLGAAATISMQGCGNRPAVSGELRLTELRSRKLMALASEEAAQISDVDVRLTRLLNLADTQMQREWKADARTTLAEGRKTLGSEDAKKLNDHARISGWISISELARRTDDPEGAMVACENAVTAIRAIPDPARRCDYVMGTCNELQYLKGKSAAISLLSESAPWTKSIDDVPRRRQAVVSFAAALFNLDDFGAGQQMLRQETDAVWRSDTLTRLAMINPAPQQAAYGRAGNAKMSAPAAPTLTTARSEASADTRGTEDPAPYFGKQLRYDDVFRGQMTSQTQKD